MQYIFNKYGRDRAAIVATVTEQQAKGAMRHVGKAIGLSSDSIDRLAKLVGHWGENDLDVQEIGEEGFDLNDPHLKKTLELAHSYIGFPGSWANIQEDSLLPEIN